MKTLIILALAIVVTEILFGLFVESVKTDTPPPPDAEEDPDALPFGPVPREND